MRHLIRCFVASLFLLTSLTAVFPVHAHSGGTDRCGGHHDRKRGGYHVHNHAKYCACHPEAAGCSSGREPSPAPDRPRGEDEAGPKEKQETTVYVTRTGEKYHRDGCRHLRSSKIPMDLKEAAKKYGPCSVCKPPVPK